MNLTLLKVYLFAAKKSGIHYFDILKNVPYFTAGKYLLPKTLTRSNHPIVETNRRRILILEENMIKLDANMRKLSVEIRESILLKFFQNLTFDEVAAINGDSTGAVKMRIYRGLKQLKQMMDDENI